MYLPSKLRLSNVYKLFPEQLAVSHVGLYDFQPPKQAGFQKDFITVDHINLLEHNKGSLVDVVIP